MLEIFRFGLEGKEQASLTTKAEKSYEKSRENCTTGPLYSASKLSNYQASTRNSASGLRNNKSCLRYQGNHPLFHCTKVTDPRIRKYLVFKNGVCFVCLDNSYTSSKCTSNYSCKNAKDVITFQFVQKTLRMIIKTATEVKIVKTVKVKTHIKMIIKQQLLSQIM